MSYAKNKVAMTEVLTAGDILKINCAIKTVSAEPLLADEGLADSEQLVESIWSILYDLYNPQRQYPLLLESAIVCYRLLTLPKTDSFTTQTLTILLSTVYQNEFAFNGLLRQWILSIDPKVHIASIDSIDALIQILGVFQSMWAYKTQLLRILKHRKAEIIHLINENFPSSKGTEQILTKLLCIRRRDLSDRLQLSPKTVTKILKQLEQLNYLHSVKNWRETLYFNNFMIDTLKEQL
ncbi:MAG: hypothetical protein FWG61_08810 [Firmicutes bacterium]|nr:hypothetical protein [Bacillota bacterium]